MPSDIHCVTRYEEVRWVLGQPELFSSRAMETVFAKGRDFDFRIRHVIDVMRFLWRMRGSLLGFRKAGNIITLDPPRHGELRSIVNRGFTPRQIASWEPWIREIVVEEVGDKLEKAGEFDAVRDLATGAMIVWSLAGLAILWMALGAGAHPQANGRDSEESGEAEARP